MRDIERERDVFGNFSWVHTVNPGVLFTIAPFFPLEPRGLRRLPSSPPAQRLMTHPSPPITTTRTMKAASQASASRADVTTRRFGFYGFAQQDDSFLPRHHTDGSTSPSPQSSQRTARFSAHFTRPTPSSRTGSR